MERYEGNPKQVEFALQGCKYPSRYRHKILRTGKSIKELRKVAALSKTNPIYMVMDKPHRPDAEILVDICRQMIGNGVW